MEHGRFSSVAARRGQKVDCRGGRTPEQLNPFNHMDGVVDAELASGTLIVEAKLTAGLQEIAVSTAGEGRQERLESHDSRVQSQDMGSS